MSASDWDRIAALFARACELPRARRAAFLDRTCAGDPATRHELQSLLQAHERANDFLEPAPRARGEAPVEASLADGVQLGNWRVRRLLSCGGMGEVYEVERATGDFAQRAALKLLRHDADAQSERFQAEREILGRLDHAGIAKLLDGGVGEDGRPWAVLEFVDGQPITAWCQLQNASLRQRLSLFLQVCDAVAYAHRNLIVHRDLKPSNILVDKDQRVRLLDFGIAKLLAPKVWGHGMATVTQIPLTPDYCAPEQLSGEVITTATDIYQLGLLLFEILTHRQPWKMRGMPIAHALRALLDVAPPKPSEVAASEAGAVVSSRALQGDLDAIVARCLRKEPMRRYPTVEALRDDIVCHLSGEPVEAREGARLYVLGRFLRRYRWGVAAAAMLMLSLAAGLAGFAWQAGRAREQADRAEATKQFLVSVFNASNPTKAADRPRGQITAKELLDASSVRIDREFAGRPELQIELLGVTAQIYGELNEKDRYLTQHRRYIELARQFYGDLHPIVIDAYLQDADYYGRWPNLDSVEALRALNAVDPLIHRAGLDESPTRALWWETRGRVLKWDPTRIAEDEAAWTQAAELYRRTDPRDPHYPRALMELASIAAGRDEGEDREYSLLLRAREAQAKARNPDDTNGALIESSFANAEWARGDFAAADASLVRGIDIFRRTRGEHHYGYWLAVSSRALLMCEHGDRVEALRLFDEVLHLLPDDANRELRRSVAGVRSMYGTCLSLLGRNQEAIVMLESAARLREGTHWTPSAISWNRTALPNAYDGVGRYDDARQSFKAGLDVRVAQNPRDSGLVLEIRERWGRFLLTQGDAAGAEAEFREVIAQDHGRNLAFTALAHGGLARLALERHDAAAALASIRTAMGVFSNVTGPRDARMEPYLWRIYAQALAQSGDTGAAMTFAHKALDAYQRYDDPASPDIVDTASLVGVLTRSLSQAR
ncbi:protein kinase domain-containing protein [Dyella soli]|nr:serine/threonine-protein kinase [Dyella soli]